MFNIFLGTARLKNMSHYMLQFSIDVFYIKKFIRMSTDEYSIDFIVLKL